MADATSFVQNIRLGGSERDEDVIRQKFDIVLFYVLRDFDEGE